MFARQVTVCAMFAVSLALAQPAGEEGFVIVCPIEGMIDNGIGVFVERAVEEAEAARAIIFIVDTPGGMVDSAIEITKSIMSAPCPTIAYIKGMGAISAGALISYSCGDIIMKPDSNIGAATPVIASPQGMQPTGEKEVSFMRAKMRALAERNEYNTAIAEAMVDKDIELVLRVDSEGGTHISGRYPDLSKEEDKAPVAVIEDPAKIARRLIEELPAELDAVKRLADDILREEEEEPAAEPLRDEADLAEGGVLLPAGKLLTLTPREAIKYGLIPTTANNLEEVMAYYGYHGAEVRRLEMTWAEDVFRFLSNPMIAGLLLMLGIGGLYLEMKTPGFGVPGTIGLVCLGLFFGSHMVLAVAEWLDVILVLAGIGLLLIEVLILPGFGAAGVGGIVCLALGFYLSLTNVTIPQYSWDYERLQDAFISLLVALATLAAMIAAMWKLFPRTPFYGRLVLQHAQMAGDGYVVQTAEQHDAAIGMEGVAVSMLRPAGRGRFGGETYQVMSRSDYIGKGTPIRIVRAEGNRYVVDKL